MIELLEALTPLICFWLAYLAGAMFFIGGFILRLNASGNVPARIRAEGTKLMLLGVAISAGAIIFLL